MISTFWSYQTVQPSFMSKQQQSNSSGFLNVMQWFQCHALFSLKRATVQISTTAPPAGVQQPFTHCTGLTQKNYSDYSMLPQLQKNLYTSTTTISCRQLLSFSSNLIIMPNISFNGKTQSVHACVKFQRKDDFIVANILYCSL